MARPLKVFRTAIGFHDAYVAVPTQKAALEAFGSDRNLFASGRAELVEDPKLTKAPLAQPGTVIKVLRGSAAEQFAALGPSRAKRVKAKTAAPARAKPTPRPSRQSLDRAEAKLARAEQTHAAKLEKVADREADLRRERRGLEQARDKDLAALQREIDSARAAYDEAMAAWRG